MRSFDLKHLEAIFTQNGKPLPIKKQILRQFPFLRKGLPFILTWTIHIGHVWDGCMWLTFQSVDVSGGASRPGWSVKIIAGSSPRSSQTWMSGQKLCLPQGMDVLSNYHGFVRENSSMMLSKCTSAIEKMYNVHIKYLELSLDIVSWHSLLT